MSNKTYAVGRGKPPTHTQFKKGQSGNPSGRRKKEQTLDDLVVRELERTMMVTSASGRRQRVPMKQALAKSIVRDALRGDKRALRLITEMEARVTADNMQMSQFPRVIRLDMTGDLAASGDPDFPY